MQRNSPEWFKDWFGQDYLLVYDHRDQASAVKEAAFAAKHLEVGNDTQFLDIACGNGRHLVEMLQYTEHVYGADLSAALLARASSNATGAYLARADMRSMPWRENSFEAVASFFTSFGYFADQSDDLSVLREVRRVLRPGGRFLLDLMNAEAAVKNLVPHSERTVGQVEVIEARSFDPHLKRIEKQITLRSSEGEKRFTESVRVYSPGELIELFAGADLKVQKRFGNFDGQAFSEDRSSRLIVIAS